jgi:hypothetical protein
MSKWFYGIFLPSIFERCEPGKGKWLSQKQTRICTENMVRTQVRYDSDGYGTMHTHDNYTCEWEGRTVHLSYSKKNGCGCIEFGFNAEEIAAMSAEREAEQKRIKAERIERIKRNPERLAKKLADLDKKIQGWKEEYELDLADGDEDAVKYDLEAIAELEAELALYMRQD